jgi:hypothetical protein
VRIKDILNSKLGDISADVAWTASDWRKVALALIAFLSRLEDGVAIGGEIGGHKLRANIIIDPNYATFPSASCLFTGGPAGFDGKRFTLTEAAQRRRSITLTGGHVYAWDGYQFVYDGPSEVTDPQE